MEKAISIRCEGAQSIDIDDLIPFQDDIKSMTPSVLKKLENVILEQGFSEPIAVWANSPDGKHFILNGHQRHTALQSLRSRGFFVPPIPVAMVQAVDENEARRKVITLASQYGDFSANHLSEFIAKANLDLDWIKDNSRLAAGDFKWPKIESESDPLEDELPEESAKPFVKQGDLFILDRHRLLCGDSTQNEDLDFLLKSDRPEMLFTDPPYGVSFVGVKGSMFVGGKKSGIDSNQQIQGDDLRGEELSNLFKDSISIGSQYLIDEAAAYIFFAINRSEETLKGLKDCGLEIRNWLIWDKGNVGFHAMGAQYKPNYESFLYCHKKNKSPLWNGDANQQTIWRHSVERLGLHPTMKPVSLIEQAINNHNPEIVLDLFGGSGSTLIACEKTDRSCRMMELDPIYCGVILDRWEKMTGKEAVRDDGIPWSEVKRMGQDSEA